LTAACPVEKGSQSETQVFVTSCWAGPCSQEEGVHSTAPHRLWAVLQRQTLACFRHLRFCLASSSFDVDLLVLRAAVAS
jgi:hypothetical protein